MRKRTARLISALAIALLLIVQVGPVWAQTAPEAPPPPENTEEAPTAPDAPEKTEEAPESPTAPDAPTLEELLDEEETSQETQTEESNSQQDSNPTSSDGNQSQSQEGNTSLDDQASEDPGEQTHQSGGTGNQSGDGQVGDTSIKTGDATNTATITTAANNNTSTGEECGGTCQPGGATVQNTDNGSGSTNTGSVKVSDNNTTEQNNSAKVENNLEQTTNTGTNSTSKNTGGNSSIDTGDANTSGTVITAVNTNIDGVAVAEFNVADDHIGDIVLDFGANCISGCGGTSPALAKNEGNGADSVNDASIEQMTNNATFQNNDATVENNMILSSNTGDNTADQNTGGDSEIETGDANVSANVLTFANNNLTGGVYYYVVNIFGDLVGDIIFPEELLAYGVTAANIGNGADSTNTAIIDQTTNNTTVQTNTANIQNNLNLATTTGNNSTSKNTGGNSSIETGDASINAQVLNIANSNISGGSWWLVIVNEAGRWIGKLFGGNGGNYAGSQGTEFTVNEAGEITAVNSGNGAGSTNNANITQETNNTTVQTNTANITNNLDLSANTGGNSASRNTGGDSSIETGDASIIANLVNFVNNNITGGGKLFVTVINVFGSWVGDFLPPGFSKPEVPEALADENPDGVGGLPAQPSSNSNGNTHSSNDESGGDSSSDENTSSSTGDIGPLAASIISQFTGSSFPQIAGTGVEAETFREEIAAKKVININLAWLLLLIPVAGLLIIAKRFVLIRG